MEDIRLISVSTLMMAQLHSKQSSTLQLISQQMTRTSVRSGMELHTAIAGTDISSTSLLSRELVTVLFIGLITSLLVAEKLLKVVG
jgi:succinylglutamate desuccinylase